MRPPQGGSSLPARLYRLAAISVPIPAFVPSMIAVVAVMIMVIVAFVRLDDAAHYEADQAEQNAALRDSLYTFHGHSK
jgi:hypothetical protein